MHHIQLLHQLRCKRCINLKIESCAVIGLGLVGQLTIQILKAAGVGRRIDIDPKMVNLALKSGADLSFSRKTDNLKRLLINEFQGFG